MNGWIESVWQILKREEEIEAAEEAERASWTWLEGDWTGREMERERAFLVSMDTEAETIPDWVPLSEGQAGPTPFLEAMQNGLRLIKLHNAVVMKIGDSGQRSSDQIGSIRLEIVALSADAIE